MSPQKTFVYGIIRWPTKGRTPLGLPPPPRAGDTPQADIAVEVLREFGATELRGKLYARPVNNSTWFAMPPDFIKAAPWYKFFQEKPKQVVFDMEGSGPWEILYFRNESDETGTYVAIALRLLAESPPWVQFQRRQEVS